MDKKLKAGNLDPAVYALFDDYVHNAISRREFLNRLSKCAVAGMSASAIFAFLAPNYVLAEQVKSDDPRIKSEYIEYDSSGAGRIDAFGRLPRQRRRRQEVTGHARPE